MIRSSVWTLVFATIILLGTFVLVAEMGASPQQAARAAKSSRGEAALNDNAVTITFVAKARAALRRQIWGEAELPGTVPVVTTLQPAAPEWAKVTSKMALKSADFERVDKLSFALAAGQSSVGYLFTAKESKRLVIVHQGHGCTFGPAGAGLQRLIGELLSNGYSVVALYMPRPADCGGNLVAYHAQLFQQVSGKLRGSPLQLFVEPVVQTVNYALKSGYARVDMVGLSGGGWTTTVAAAVDPRIKLSVPVAGSFPRQLPCGINVNDPEQDAIASYLNLYVLGSLGAGRRQIQVLNEYDRCCFKVKCDRPQHDNQPDIESYERLVQDADQKLGVGNFSVHIDFDSHQHQISAKVTHDVILPALKQ